MQKIVPLLVCLVLGSAFADTRVPNTKVSYNENMVFIDEQNSTNGKTYVAFVCSGYGVEFKLYSKNPLSSEREFAKSSAMNIIAYADGETLVQRSIISYSFILPTKTASGILN